MFRTWISMGGNYFFFLLSFFIADKALVTYILLNTEEKVSFVPFSVWKRRRTNRPATGRAGKSERLLVLFFTIMLMLVLMLMFVLLLLFLVLMVMVVMVVAVFGGRRFFSKYWEWSCCNWMHTHLQRWLFFTFKIKNTQMNSC